MQLARLSSIMSGSGQKSLDFVPGVLCEKNTACVRAIFWKFLNGVDRVPDPTLNELNNILSEAENGDQVGTAELFPLVYDELLRLARSKLAYESPDQSLQTTELVHEAYVRLAGTDSTWEGNRHFFAAAAEAMRRILIDRARRKGATKHGGQFQRVHFEEQSLLCQSFAEQMLMVDDLIDRFAEQHPREAEIAKLHYFSGFSIRECAKALGIPASSAHDRWRFARAWLSAEIIDRRSCEAAGHIAPKEA